MQGGLNAHTGHRKWGHIENDFWGENPFFYYGKIELKLMLYQM